MVGVTQNPNFLSLLCQIPLKLAIGIFKVEEMVACLRLSINESNIDNCFMLLYTVYEEEN